MRLTSALLLVTAAVVGGCSSYRIRLDDGLTSGLSASSYSDVVRAWTRKDTGWKDLVANVIARVTYKSRDLRYVQVLKLAKDLGLSVSEREALQLKEARDAQQYHTFFFSVSTNQRKWNNLDRKQESIWHIVLENDRGERLNAHWVRGLDEDFPQYRSLYPHVTPYAQFYHVRFKKQLPSGQPIIGARTRWFAVYLRSVVGAVKLVWKVPQR